MPTYEYECRKCGHRYALTMSIDDQAKGEPRCPSCKSQQSTQVFEPVFVRTARKS